MTDLRDRRRRLALWVRWSWRDLRARWLLVLSIALIIGLGTGLFAGLGSTATWRRRSNDASYAQLRLHDVEVRLATDQTVAQGQLQDLVDRLPHPTAVAAAEERLVLPTQIDAPGGDRPVLVPGQITGAGSARRPAQIDRTWITEGTDLSRARAGRPTVLIDSTLARRNHLPASGTLRIAGGRAVPWIGQALQPEWFLVTDPRGGALSGSSYGVLYSTLADAQTLFGRPGQVNSLVLEVAPGASRAALVRDLQRTLTEGGEPIAATVTTRDDIPGYRILYKDIDGDQQVWNAVSLIVLAGAAFAAANLVNRIIEAQRRELGVGMAVGARPVQLALRPILVGLQVGILGVALGVVTGLAIDRALQSVLDDVLPLPTWQTPFQPALFARAAALGLVLPLLATLYPVIRAVRVQPVDALQTTKPSAGRTPLGRLSRSIHFSGPSVRLLPVRDLVRAPRRAFFTAVGIAAAITVLVGVMGMMDSYLRVIDRAETEMTAGLDQVNVDLETFQPTSSTTVTGLAGLPSVGRSEVSLLLPARVSVRGAEPIDTLVEVLDLDLAETRTSSTWAPSIASGRAPGADEILLSRKASTDLGVGVGGTVTLTHPSLRKGTMEITRSRLTVAGLHGNPLRAFAYLDDVEAARFGLEGMTNELRLTPAPGATASDVQRAAFGRPGVTSARSVRTTTQLLRSTVDQYLGILRVVEAIPVGLALLVAFNSSTIGAEERRRDHATMFAFGLAPRRVLGLLTFESLATGILGTGIGLGFGYLLVRWVMGSIVGQTMPEIAITPVLSTTTLFVAGIGGIVMVGLAPLLVYRRLKRLDIAASLRVME